LFRLKAWEAVNRGDLPVISHKLFCPAYESLAMPDDETSLATAPAKKSGAKNHPLVGPIVIIAVVFALAQVLPGVISTMGWDGTAAFNALLQESDAAYQAALKPAEVAAPLFSSLMEAIDAQPLSDARLEQGENAKQAIAAFKEAATQFALAGKKIDEAMTKGIKLSDEHTKALTLRAKACALLADVCGQNAGICEAVVDDSITTKEALVAKVLELATKRDATQKEADATIVESEELAKKVAPN